MAPTYRYPSEPVPVAVGGAWRRGLPWTIDAVGAVSLYDTRVNRPGAGTLPASSVFFATDTGECFSTNGVAWTRVAWSDLVVADVAGAEATANKGAASGYAGLDAGTHVPQTQLGTGSAGAGHKYLSDAQTFNTIPVADVTGAEATANKGAASGYAGLDAGTHVPQAQLGSGSGGAGTKVLYDDQTYKAPAVSGGTFTKVFDSALGAPAASIDTGAAAIPGTAALLYIVTLARTTEAIAVSTATLRFNADAGANYDRVFTQDSNATVSGGNTLAQTSLLLACPGSLAAAGTVGVASLEIPGYAAAVFHKVGTWLWSVPDATAANNRQVSVGTRWRNTGAISQVTLTAGAGTLVTGSRMLIYTA